MGEACPLAIIQDRYGGIYSGGSWLAIAQASELVDGIATRAQFCLTGNAGPSDSNTGARAFWSNPPEWIAVGNSPDEAIEALCDKIAGPEISMHVFRRKDL